MAEIIWTETALNDIDNIAEYISADSPFNAAKFVQKIFSSVVKLENFPQIGKFVPELPVYNYRQILFKKNVLFIAFNQMSCTLSLFTILRDY